MRERFSRIIKQGKVAPWQGDVVMHLRHGRSLTLKVQYCQSWLASSFHSHNTAADYTGTGAWLSHKPDKSPTALPRWLVGRKINDNLSAPGATEVRFSSPTRTASLRERRYVRSDCGGVRDTVECVARKLISRLMLAAARRRDRCLKWRFVQSTSYTRWFHGYETTPGS